MRPITLLTGVSSLLWGLCFSFSMVLGAGHDHLGDTKQLRKGFFSYIIRERPSGFYTDLFVSGTALAPHRGILLVKNRRWKTRRPSFNDKTAKGKHPHRWVLLCPVGGPKRVLLSFEPHLVRQEGSRCHEHFIDPDVLKTIKP